MSHWTAWAMVCGSQSCSMSTSSCQDTTGTYVGRDGLTGLSTWLLQAPTVPSLRVLKEVLVPTKAGTPPQPFGRGALTQRGPTRGEGRDSQIPSLSPRPWAFLRRRGRPALHLGTCQEEAYGLREEGKHPGEAEAGVTVPGTCTRLSLPGARRC